MLSVPHTRDTRQPPPQERWRVLLGSWGRGYTMEELLQIMAGGLLLVIAVAAIRADYKRRKGGVIK